MVILVDNKFTYLIGCIFLFAIFIYLIFCVIKELRLYKNFDLSKKMDLKKYNKIQDVKTRIIAYIILSICIGLLSILALFNLPKIITGFYDNNFIIHECEITDYLYNGVGNPDMLSCKNDNLEINGIEFYSRAESIDEDSIGNYICIKIKPNRGNAEIIKMSNEHNLSCDEFYWQNKNEKNEVNYNYSIVKCEISKYEKNRINCRINNKIYLKEIDLLNNEPIKKHNKICLKYYWNNNTGEVLYSDDSNKKFSCDDYIEQEEK